MNDPRELLSRLAAPFAAEDLEWRLQIGCRASPSPM